MCLVRFIAAASVLSFPWPSAAQDWIEYISLTDRFSMNLPGEPEIREISYAIPTVGNLSAIADPVRR